MNMPEDADVSVLDWFGFRFVRENNVKFLIQVGKRCCRRGCPSQTQIRKK